MLSKPASCSGCPLCGLGQGYSLPDGTGRNHALLLGEALGSEEAACGLPFQGQAGHMLNRILGRTRLTRNDFKIWNVVACRPPNNFLVGAPWYDGATAHCMDKLRAVLTATKPAVIVPMGNVALQAMTGGWGIEDRRGYVYPSAIPTEWPMWVVPTVHPSYVMQGNQNWTGVVARDLSKAMEVVSKGYVEPPCRYVEHPTGADVDLFIDAARSAVGRGAWLTADIETPRSGATKEDEYGTILDTEIQCISFAFEAHHAITIPWRDEFIVQIQTLLNLFTPYLCFWNADFDVPRIKSKGLTIGPKILDSMYMWHFLQSDLPKSLGFVATFYTELSEWKSKSEAYPEFYSCRDADAQIQCTYGIRDNLLKQKRFDRFISDYVETQPILDDMGRSGVLIDREKREAFRQAIQEEKHETEAKIQEAVPVHLRPFKPYRRVPDEVQFGHPKRVGKRDGVWDCDPETGEWGVRFPFLCNSADQVKKYIRYRGHPVPRNHKTGKDTTGKLDLAVLARKYPKDPFYRLVVEDREASKILGQYIEGYEPDPDGCIRTHFNQKPSTWRCASEGPNVQNIRKRWKLAKRYREQFRARPGHVLVELDYRAIEAVLVGYYADDPDYIHAAKIGVHAILAAYVMGTALKDWWRVWDARVLHEAVHKIKQEHPKEYDDCKHVVHGSNYGGTPFKMKVEFPDSFPTVKVAKEMQDLYFSTIAKKVQKWQLDTLLKCGPQQYLESAFGYRHYFYDPGYWSAKENKFVYGSDAKRALAFLPQNTAAAVIKAAIRRIASKPFYRKALRWMIHDSLILELPNDSLLGDRIRWVAAQMQQPIPELGNLVIEVEVTVGQNWGEMRDFAL